MSVLKVNTLGCHPMLLLKKMEAAGGITILKEEKRTFSGVDYPYRIIAQVAEGMYLEAHDFIHEAATTEDKLPYLLGYLDYSPPPTHYDGYQMEATEADKASPIMPSTTTHRAGALILQDAVRVPEANLCVMVTLGTAVYGDSLTSSYTTIMDCYLAPSPLFAWATASDLSRVMLTDNTEKALALEGLAIFFQGTGSETGSGTYPFAIFAGMTNCLQNYFEEGSSSTPGNGITIKFSGREGDYPSIPLVVSASRIRISTSVSAENELVSPSDWMVFPIFTSIGKSDNGLFFETGPAGDHGGSLAFVRLDTSKGNNFGDGECVALYKNFPQVFRAYGATPPPREQILVYGTPANANASKTMYVYIATPPVSQDIVVGGPVVSEVYAFDSDEIRGAVQGVLGIAETVDVGTMGWLDGNRYRVLIPGRMTQVG